MNLQELHDKLLAEGCNRFFIDCVGGPISDDVERLGLHNGAWEVYYSERGIKSKPLFSTAAEKEAIEFYYNHVINIEHWHIIAFTRSADVINNYRKAMEEHDIRTIHNDIPSYSVVGDRVYRLFVVNKDIFRAREILETVPFVDEELKRRSAI